MLTLLKALAVLSAPDIRELKRTAGQDEETDKNAYNSIIEVAALCLIFLCRVTYQEGCTRWPTAIRGCMPTTMEEIVKTVSPKDECPVSYKTLIDVLIQRQTRPLTLPVVTISEGGGAKLFFTNAKIST